MIYIIAGDIGSGKTLKALQWMEAAHASGRAIFTNIQLKPACPYYNHAVLLDEDGYPISAERPHVDTGHQFFWEFVPDDALIVIDEGDIHFDSSDWKTFGANCKIYHKQSRKFAHDIVYIVQNVTNLYKRIRTLAGRFILAEHTYRTLRTMGFIESMFGKQTALKMSRFIYGEFADERFADLRGMGHVTYTEAQRYFSWYETKQLLGNTQSVLKRNRKQILEAAAANDPETQLVIEQAAIMQAAMEKDKHVGTWQIH